MCIFFLHVPKTAGQSFRKASIDYFGKKSVLLLYGENSSTTTTAVRDIFYKNTKNNLVEKFSLISELIERENIAFFSSHASATSLPNFQSTNASIFVREPIERIISHYNYAMKKGHIIGSFEEFIENPRYQNLYSKILCGVPIESIKFIGLTEKFEESLKLFNINFNTDFKVCHINKLWFFSKKISSKKISKKLEDRIREVNEKDFVLYEKAKKLFTERIIALEIS